MALFVLSLYPYDTSVGVGAFVKGLSQISSFLSLPGYVSVLLHIKTSVAFPGHWSPSYCGDGLVHARFRVCTPDSDVF